jgi:hypothetical protein
MSGMTRSRRRWSCCSGLRRGASAFVVVAQRYTVSFDKGDVGRLHAVSVPDLKQHIDARACCRSSAPRSLGFIPQRCAATRMVPPAGDAQTAKDGPEADGVVIGGGKLRHLATIRPWICYVSNARHSATSVDVSRWHLGDIVTSSDETRWDSSHWRTCESGVRSGECGSSTPVGV